MDTISLVGICCDHNSTYLRGAAAAPVKIRRALNCRIIGADIVEYNPARDVGDITAMAAAKLLKEIAAQMVRPSI